MQEFQLRVFPLGNNEFSLELYQCAYKKAGQKKRPSAKRLGRLKGKNLVLARHNVYQALKANNYDPQTLSHKRQKPYILDEETGVNLAILFQVLQPLRKEDKIVNITAGVKEMSNEESHYWFAKINNGRRNPALKAMRILLGE
ncbi:MAG: hypothetical protein SAJ12_21075 [Jaaginema sp. PMC 1079.18]|nr:hypothetical protein [Jaaginema sp. PMC 1080.18]MEC4853480.1 hypothetical protein [Jaaginema sp. PMC 1079.18]MEC4868420.1 hypothetical protein [Jaaginema sp. PMC 1078.18]